MSLKLEEIKKLIKESIPDAEITIQDLAGDENHYSATIKSKIFNGKSKNCYMSNEFYCRRFRKKL